MHIAARVLRNLLGSSLTPGATVVDALEILGRLSVQADDQQADDQQADDPMTTSGIMSDATGSSRPWDNETVKDLTRSTPGT